MAATLVQVIDCDAGKAWHVNDRAEAIRYTGLGSYRYWSVVEVVHKDAQLLVLPPDAPFAKSS